ncbi:MAG TPA: hypothetical protein VEB65_13880 [Solirubrobacterales bacterium]|nr:hypothetical protein [Solirubrobacterales bacterium]
MRLARTCFGPALLAALAVLAGCGGGGNDETTPVACFEGAGAYERALADAPGEVRIGGQTLISECLTRNQEGGELAQVGEALVEAATRIDAEAREDPGGQANLELGYLLGAAQRGSEETAGIHSDLLRRLEVAAQFSPGKQPLPSEFRAAYRRGFDAGHENG